MPATWALHASRYGSLETITTAPVLWDSFVLLVFGSLVMVL